MKTARFILKVAATCLAVAAAVCCIVAYWDKIVDAATAIGAKVGCPRCQERLAEYDDYADWDD